MTATEPAIIRPEGRDRLGEGVFWSGREQALYWVDILGQQLYRHDPATGATRHWAMPEMTGWLIERASGGFVAGLQSGFHALSLDPFALTPLAAPEAHLPDNRMNDACADAAGRIWAGTMRVDCTGEAGALYRLGADGAVARMDAPYGIANGPAISPDGATLYHTDSAKGLVYRFALHGDGSLGPRETFLAFPEAWGSPDGMTCDAEGGLWIAHWGAGCVSRFLPDGTRAQVITLPASQITRPCFGGPGLDTLYVTSAADGVDEPLAGCVFALSAPVRGLPARSFAG